MDSHRGAHRARIERISFVLCILTALAFPLAGVVGAAGPGDVTVQATVHVERTAGVDEIGLVSLTTRPGASGPVALGLVWQQDTLGWFPSWGLYLVSDVGLLPSGEPAEAGIPEVKLSEAIPVVGHAYEATLSYSPSLGAVSLRVFDATQEKDVYRGGFTVPAHDGVLYAASGSASPEYLPVGVTWDVGARGPSGQFVPLTKFATREEAAVVRLDVPPPAPPGEFRFTLQHAGRERLVGTLAPAAGELWLPLDLTDLPLGASLLRMAYVADGRTLLSEGEAIVLGRIDVSVGPAVADRRAGELVSSIRVRSGDPLTEPVEVEVGAAVSELVWDPVRRDFDAIPYREHRVFDGALDLTSGTAELPVAIPLPARPGNWRIRYTVDVDPEIPSLVSSQERLFTTHLPAEIAQGEAYTFVVFPDTQYMAQSHPHILTRMTDWVSAHAAEMNIAAVLHVGDITNHNAPAEWENAVASMGLLHGVVPYVLTVGNHDMSLGPGMIVRGASRINEYFPPESAKRHSNLAGTMEAGRLENHYARISVGDTDYLVIALEFGPPDEALRWANDVARRYPDDRVILLTHSYTSTNGSLSRNPASTSLALEPGTTVNTGVEMWQDFVRLHANSFMVVSGHVSPTVPVVPYRAARAVPGQTVYELLFDLQNQENGGNGWLGLLTFRPDDTVTVRLYSPYLGEFADEMDGNGFTSGLVLNLDDGSVSRVYNGYLVEVMTRYSFEAEPAGAR